MRIAVLSLFVAALTAPSLAKADLTIEQYTQARKAKNQEVVKIYLGGLIEGLTWANTDLKHTKTKELFCLPNLLVFNADNAASLLESYIASPRTTVITNETPVALALLLAMKDQFPCK